METTVIGSYPKPSYLNLPDWFKSNEQENVTNITIDTNDFMTSIDKKKLENDINQGVEEIIIEQKELGIDVITDGELRRENYIYSFCR